MVDYYLSTLLSELRQVGNDIGSIEGFLFTICLLLVSILASLWVVAAIVGGVSDKISELAMKKRKWK